MKHDKKVVAGTLHFVLPTSIGSITIVDDVTGRRDESGATNGGIRRVIRSG